MKTFQAIYVRCAKILINYVVIITAPLWIYVVVFHAFQIASDSAKVLKGDKFFWELSE